MEQLLNRGVEALEKIAADPIIEYESGPPICPHCGQYDPEIHTTASDSASGPLSEVVVSGQCGNCGNVMYAVIESYSMHKHKDSAVAEMLQRKEERTGNDENG